MSNKETYDVIFDALVKEALKNAESEPNLNLPEEMDVEFSEEHKAKMKSIFDKEKKRIWRKKVYKSVQRMAACFFILIVVSGITVMSVDALRIKFLNFVFNTYQTNTEITASEEIQGSIYDTDELTLEYIPTGFNLDKQNISDDMIYLIFRSGEDNVSIMVSYSDGTTSIDTENANCEQMTVNGLQSLYSENQNGNMLTMYDENKVYVLKSTISKDEIVKIAQNIKKQ